MVLEIVWGAISPLGGVLETNLAHHNAHEQIQKARAG